MKILSQIEDKRINSRNVYIECTYGEYLSFATQITKNNELQRKRVKSSKTVYSLLKEDLKAGCIIPPIVLAIDSIDINSESENKNLLNKIMQSKDKLVILDGLQRTFTMIDANDELKRLGNIDELNLFLDSKFRLEIYVGINKFGILYRMLTLNTGQTPMSMRHQVEMLYRDLLNTKIDGIKIIPDTDGYANYDNNEFSFKNILDGFNAYITKNEIPFDRLDILENIKTLENMSKERVSDDLFREFIISYIVVFRKLLEITPNNESECSEVLEENISHPFAKTVAKAFSTSQALSGYGAAIGKMREYKLLNSFDEIKSIIDKLENSDGQEWFLMMLQCLDRIKDNSKKIGNAQRMFFQYFFRELLNKDSDSYLKLVLSVENGYKKYNSQVN